MADTPAFPSVGLAAELLNQKGINRVRFGGAGELLGQGAALIDATGRERLGGARFLLVAQATRAQHTFEAVIACCQIGRGVQAAMLNRSLLDDVLDIHWTAEHPEEAPERADQHDRLIALAEHDLEDRFDRTDRSLTDAERAELDELMKLYAGERGKAFDRPWHRADFTACSPWSRSAGRTSRKPLTTWTTSTRSSSDATTCSSTAPRPPIARSLSSEMADAIGSIVPARIGSGARRSATVLAATT